MKLVLFTAAGDGSQVAINPEKVAQAIAYVTGSSVPGGEWTRLTLDHGREVDVTESFSAVCSKLQEATL